jgi:hypothetical protein
LTNSFVFMDEGLYNSYFIVLIVWTMSGENAHKSNCFQTKMD